MPTANFTSYLLLFLLCTCRSDLSISLSLSTPKEGRKRAMLAVRKVAICADRWNRGFSVTTGEQSNRIRLESPALAPDAAPYSGRISRRQLSLLPPPFKNAHPVHRLGSMRIWWDHIASVNLACHSLWYCVILFFFAPRCQRRPSSSSSLR